jgi:putative ABC transport system permease protein
VVGLLLAQALRPVGLGVAIGAAAALNLSALLEGYVFGITPADPRVLASTAVAMLAASACAAAIPATRATKFDPATTLRAD